MSELKITKIRIERDDGTYIQLTDPQEIEKWNKMVHSQATMAFVHGMHYEPINWEEGTLEPVNPITK